jgi:two-component system NtrC family sensor kinase
MDTPPEKIPLPPDDQDIHTFIHQNGEAERFLYATTWLKDKNWILVIRQEKADAFMALRKARLPILFISLMGGGCIIAAAFALTHAIVRRMERTDAEKALLGQQLIGASRLAELGEMAAGFAHEINNPLQIMSAELSLIRLLQTEMVAGGDIRPGESFDQVADSVDQIKSQIDRCSRITAAILKFGRQGESKVEELDLTVTVPEIVEMVARKAEVHGIHLERRLPDTPIRVVADASRLQQVLLNLLNNAMDAIIEHHGTAGGVIAVALGNGDEGLAKISIQDNGTGIAPENMEKIFSPFFTTKPVGKGTGLGLSVCYGIIQQMGGRMEVQSTVGKGATFCIALPVFQPAA